MVKLAKVSIVQCLDYDLERVEAAVRRCVDLLGGIDRFVKPGQKVLLKANLLAPTKPEQAVTTHPAVVQALARLVREAGGQPLVADSPGPLPYTRSGLEKVYRAAGFLAAAAAGDFELNWDTTVAGISYPAGRVVKKMSVIRPVVEADVIIALPKLKTHVLTTLTGACKILFGVIPGFAKAGYHAQLKTGEQFAAMLLDITEAARPSFFLLDGILALEDDGPGLHGRPRPLGVVLGSCSHTAMDTVACKITGLDPMQVPMLRQERERKGEEELEILGENLSKVAVDDFLPPAAARDARGVDRLPAWQRVLLPLAKRTLSLRPVPRQNDCTGCGTCVKVCPQKAITIKKGLALIDQRACIRCYCCHEMCPAGAVDLRHGFGGRVVSRLGFLGRRD